MLDDFKREEIKMKNILKILIFTILLALIFFGCSKRPTAEIADAEAAVEAVSNEGADVYAKEELMKLQDDFGAAWDEVNAQNQKFIKKYGKAKEMFIQVKANAEALEVQIQGRKEQAKNNALTVLDEAKAVLDEAKALLEKTPKGKDNRADINAFQADLKGLEDLIPEIQKMIDQEEFFSASDKAQVIKIQVGRVTDQIKEAMEKVKKY
jgi:hypothetical protein